MIQIKIRLIFTIGADGNAVELNIRNDRNCVWWRIVDVETNSTVNGSGALSAVVVHIHETKVNVVSCGRCCIPLLFTEEQNKWSFGPITESIAQYFTDRLVTGAENVISMVQLETELEMGM